MNTIFEKLCNKTDKPLFFLMERNRELGELAEFIYGKRSSSNTSRYRRDIYPHLKKFISIKKDKKVPIKTRWRKEIRGWKTDKKAKIVHMKWDVLLSYLEDEMKRRNSCAKIHTKIISKELKKFIIDNREFLFDVKRFKTLFYKKKEWKLPSIFGFLNIAFFYFLHYLIQIEKEKGMKVYKADQMLSNIQILLTYYYKDLFEDGISIEESEKTQMSFIKNYYKSCKNEFKKKEIDTRPVRDYFQSISLFNFLNKKRKWFGVISMLEEGLPVNLETKKIDEIVKYIKSQQAEYLEIIHEKKEKGKIIELSREKKKIIRKPEYVSYDLSLTEILHYHEPLKVLMNLFK